jgi:hypothetical protein
MSSVVNNITIHGIICLSNDISDGLFHVDISGDGSIISGCVNCSSPNLTSAFSPSSFLFPTFRIDPSLDIPRQASLSSTWEIAGSSRFRLSFIADFMLSSAVVRSHADFVSALLFLSAQHPSPPFPLFSSLWTLPPSLPVTHSSQQSDSASIWISVDSSLLPPIIAPCSPFSVSTFSPMPSVPPFETEALPIEVSSTQSRRPGDSVDAAGIGVGAIAGIAVGLLALAAVIGIFFLMRWRRQEGETAYYSEELVAEIPSASTESDPFRSMQLAFTAENPLMTNESLFAEPVVVPFGKAFEETLT